ncbi:MAG: hypothetical protein Q7S82_02865 [bacterium]|nr:hypothetical protein [bacterium]
MNNQNKILNKGISTPVGILIIIIVILVAGGVIVLQQRWIPEEEVKTFGVIFSPKEETADWKIYKNDKYQFEFRHPKDWMKNDICWDGNLCLVLIDYNELPTEKEYVSQGIGVEISTKENFVKHKENIEKGILPPGYLAGWKFLEIDGRKAIQTIGYDVPGGSYYIETDFFINDVGIKLLTRLPIEPYFKEELTSLRYRTVDVEKNNGRGEELRKGVYPDKEVEKAVSQYDTILSTFKFLK